MTLTGCSSPTLTSNGSDETVTGPTGGAESVTEPGTEPPTLPVGIDLPGGDVVTDPGSAPPDLTPETACVQTALTSAPVARPVDIIFVMDNSLSMDEEVWEVEAQINKNFADIIDASGIDYRVLLLSAYGPRGKPEDGKRGPVRADGLRLDSWRHVCVTEPLGSDPDADGDGECDLIDALEPPEPLPTRFRHYPAGTFGLDGPCNLLTFLDGGTERVYLTTETGPPGERVGVSTQTVTIDIPPMRDFLRPSAFKIIVFVTDNEPNCSYGGMPIAPLIDRVDPAAVRIAAGRTFAQNWMEALQRVAPEQFGTGADDRQFAVWSIVGQAPYQTSGDAPFGAPAPGDANLSPVTAVTCGDDAAAPVWPINR